MNNLVNIMFQSLCVAAQTWVFLTWRSPLTAAGLVFSASMLAFAFAMYAKTETR
jgi:hypothetical protein